MVRLGNLSRTAANIEILNDIMGQFGEVRRIELVRYEGTEKTKGVAYVRYARKE